MALLGARLVPGVELVARAVGLEGLIAGYKQRSVVERAFASYKQWRALATRYDKLAIVYRAGLVLHAIID